MAFTNAGKYGPEALFKLLSNPNLTTPYFGPLTTPTAEAPVGYTATTSNGNLTVTGPVADPIAVTIKDTGVTVGVLSLTIRSADSEIDTRLTDAASAASAAQTAINGTKVILGATPQGSSGTVQARLTGIDDRITNLPPPGTSGPAASISNTIPGLVANDGSVTVAQANSTKLRDFIATTSLPWVQYLEPGAYSFYGDMDHTTPSRGIRQVTIAAGVELVQTKPSGTSRTDSAYGLRFHGEVAQTGKALSVDAKRWDRTITLADVTGLVGESSTGAATGQMIWLYNGEPIDNRATTKFISACLRRIVDVTGNVVTLDAPLYRNFPVGGGAAVKLVTPHPSVTISGRGTIRHSNKWANNTFYNSLVRLDWCEDPVVEDISVRDGGGVGVDLINCLGGDIRCRTSNLLSDDVTPWDASNVLQVVRYGYGVYAGGGTRGVRVAGSAKRIRHSFTTGGATDAWGSPSDSKQGDPEHIDVSTITSETWHQAYDTHECGHHIRFDVNGLGNGVWLKTSEEAQQFGVNIRTTDTTVTGQVTGGRFCGVAIDFRTLAHANYGPVRLTSLRVSGCDEGVRVSGSPAGWPLGQVRLQDVDLTGCKRGINWKFGPASIRGRRVRIDASGATGLLAAINIEDPVTGGVLDLRDGELAGYATRIDFNGSTIPPSSVQFVLDTEATAGSGTVASLDDLPLSVPGTVTWTGTAWPARTTATSQLNRRVFFLGDPGGAAPADGVLNDVWPQG